MSKVAWLPGWTDSRLPAIRAGYLDAVAAVAPPKPAPIPVIDPEPSTQVDESPDDLQARIRRDLEIVMRQKPRVSQWGGSYHRAPWSSLRDDQLGPCPEHRKEAV